MHEYRFSVTRILPYKDGRVRVSENRYSRIFYAMIIINYTHIL